MGLPNILIEFKNQASTVAKRGERGIVAVIVLGAPQKVIHLEDATQIPSTLEDDSKDFVKNAFLGGVNPVKEVVLVVSDTIENGLAKLETEKFDYAAVTPDLSSSDATTVATFFKTLRDSKHIKSKVVLPNNAANHEGIINFTTDNIVVGAKTYTTAEYCSRIASLLAGTPLQQSATYFVLSEVDDVPKLTKSALDTKINNGEFCIFHDGEKVKVARAVNSLTTVTGDKTDDYKSIKIVDTMDLIYSDIKRTCEDNYIGKFPNNYDNKCNLIVAIQTYLERLRDDELLDESVTVEIDMASQIDYIKANGGDVSGMSEQEIKEYNTGTNVYISSSFKILNSIEDINIKFYI